MSTKLASGSWRETARHPYILLGLGAVALLWAGTLLLVATERQAARDTVAKDTANLARAFEENVVRTVSNIDRTLLWLRHDWSVDPALTWTSRFAEPRVATETTLQWAVIDAQGWLVASSAASQDLKRINLADRLHFKVQAEAEDDFLYISQPVLGRVSKQWSVQFTRRLLDVRGDFAGVLVASFDPGHFARFYDAVDFGTGSTTLLVGLDGVIRAGGGSNAASLGKPLGEPDLLAAIRQRLSGTVHLAATSQAPTRIASFRRVRGFPLAVVLMADEAQPDSSWLRNRPLYLASAVGLTVLMLLAIVLGLRRSYRLAETRHQLEEKSRQLEVTLENISQGIMMVDATGTIGVLNRRCAEMLAAPLDFSNRPRTYGELVHHLEASTRLDDPDLIERLDILRPCEPAASIPEYVKTLADGTTFEIRNKPLQGGGFVRTLSDITERQKAEARIVHLARHDPLTGLANRTLFRQELDAASAQLERGEPFGLLMIDLDRFKSINDSWGHLVGDQLLVEVAARLRATVRSDDLVARLGGDEFAVIVRNIPGAAILASLAERVCREAEKPFVIDGNTLLVGASIGIASAPGDGRRSMDLLQAADAAMYAAKSGSGGTYRMFTRDLDVELRQRRRTEAELRIAVAERQFELHYQPIRSISSDETTAYEALVRWNHPVRGVVPPMQFIPIAEDSGLIMAIGAWVLETACTEIKSLPGRARVAVNLSPLQFRDRNLIAAVTRALGVAGLPPERLELEITESALLQNDTLTQQHLEALRTLGVRIAMDDFGTGYSSLGYLLSYPFHSIKIDRSFVRGLGEQANSLAIVRAITTLASSLGISTTAEGVETEQQLDLLRELGCREAQGFFFSRPKSRAAILADSSPADGEPAASVAA
jgi:diguanylate cyclase (GGDEF)-like protein